MENKLGIVYTETNPTQKATEIVHVPMDIEQTIKQIGNISEHILSTADKNNLKDYIYSLEGMRVAKKKSMYWEKTKELLKFVADKGIDVTIATLPYINKGLQSL